MNCLGSESSRLPCATSRRPVRRPEGCVDRSGSARLVSRSTGGPSGLRFVGRSWGVLSRGRCTCRPSRSLTGEYVVTSVRLVAEVSVASGLLGLLSWGDKYSKPCFHSGVNMVVRKLSGLSGPFDGVGATLLGDAVVHADGVGNTVVGVADGDDGAEAVHHLDPLAPEELVRRHVHRVNYVSTYVKGYWKESCRI